MSRFFASLCAVGQARLRSHLRKRVSRHLCRGTTVRAVSSATSARWPGKAWTSAVSSGKDLTILASRSSQPVPGDADDRNGSSAALKSFTINETPKHTLGSAAGSCSRRPFRRLSCLLPAVIKNPDPDNHM